MNESERVIHRKIEVMGQLFTSLATAVLKEDEEVELVTRKLDQLLKIEHDQYYVPAGGSSEDARVAGEVLGFLRRIKSEFPV